MMIYNNLYRLRKLKLMITIQRFMIKMILKFYNKIFIRKKKDIKEILNKIEIYINKMMI